MKNATVNFGASKITVEGDVSIEELEKAGAFENLKIISDHERLEIAREPFLKKYQKEIISSFLILFGYFSYFTVGEHALTTIALFLGSIVISGRTLFKTGLKNLMKLEFDMRTLMTIAIIGAVIIGEWAEGAIVVVLFAISEALESYSMDKARHSIRSLMDLAPNEATIRRNGNEMIIPVEEIALGDTLIVKPGQKIAMDGKVTKGTSSVNQAAITGESVPVYKESGDEVFAGTLNEEGYLEIEVTKTVEDNTLSKIIHLVEEAQAERAPSQKFVDRFAKYYTPAIIGIAFLAAIIPPLLFQEPWLEWIYQGLAILVVGCPCALVISTPVSIVTAIGTAARQGVLIKGGIHLEQLGAIRAIAFDKTGTVTRGIPAVTDVHYVDQTFDQEDALKILRALEALSQHPLAKSIVSYLDHKGVKHSITVDDFTSITGKGVEGKVDGQTCWAGNLSFAQERTGQTLDDSLMDTYFSWQNQGKTVMIFGINQSIILMIAVRDEPREESRNVIENLHASGIKETLMLTGDDQKTADAIADEIGITTVRANLLPQDKLNEIRNYQLKHDKVAMVGDGVNDAPALAASTVGIAMGGAGTDTALETADIALMSDDLNKLPFTIHLSKKALAIIKQNITFALAVKFLALLLVIPNWLTLWIAIFADMGATLLVTLNGLRLLKVKDDFS